MLSVFSVYRQAVKYMIKDYRIVGLSEVQMLLAVTFLLLTTLVQLNAQAVQGTTAMRDYDKVRLVHEKTFEDFARDYLTDDGQYLRDNVFLTIASVDCWALTRSPAFEGAARYAQNLHAVTIPLETVSASTNDDQHLPVELNDCAELFFYRTGDHIQHPTGRTTDFGDETLTYWAKEHMRVDSFTFENQFPFPIRVYWHEEALTPIEQGVLQPGERMTISAFLGHIFTANALARYDIVDDQLTSWPLSENEEDEEQERQHAVDQYNTPAFRRIVDYFAVEGEEWVFAPGNRLFACDVEDEEQTQPFVEQPVSCSNLLLRFLEFSHREWHVKRLALNFAQPKLVHGYSPVGFEARKLPADTFQFLQDWYAEAQRTKMESEDSAGPCMNQHVAPSLVTHLDGAAKERLRRDLQPLLEQWYGRGPLKLTSIYGIRRYTNGSVLRMHVDTATTHVVSAIINVAQDVDEDWPLLILDHEYAEHNVHMAAGDMVFYESAKALHGRPTPMQGRSYDNVFIHFQPLNGWNYDWI